jgi:hypothetical protein
MKCGITLGVIPEPGESGGTGRLRAAPPLVRGRRGEAPVLCGGGPGVVTALIRLLAVFQRREAVPALMLCSLSAPGHVLAPCVRVRINFSSQHVVTHTMLPNSSLGP